MVAAERKRFGIGDSANRFYRWSRKNVAFECICCQRINSGIYTSNASRVFDIKLAGKGPCLCASADMQHMQVLSKKKCNFYNEHNVCTHCSHIGSINVRAAVQSLVSHVLSLCAKVSHTDQHLKI